MRRWTMGVSFGMYQLLAEVAAESAEEAWEKVFESFSGADSHSRTIREYFPRAGGKFEHGLPPDGYLTQCYAWDASGPRYADHDHKLENAIELVVAFPQGVFDLEGAGPQISAAGVRDFRGLLSAPKGTLIWDNTGWSSVADFVKKRS